MFFSFTYWFYQFKNFSTVNAFGKNVLILKKKHSFTLRSPEKVDWVYFKALLEKNSITGDQTDILFLQEEVKWSPLLRDCFIIFKAGGKVACACFNFRNGFEEISDFDFRIHIEEKKRYNLKNKFYVLEKL